MSPTRKGDKAAVTKRGRVLAAALSLATHLLILFALFWVWPEAPRFVEPAAATLDLIGPPGPAPKAPSPAPAAPAAPVKSQPAKPPPRRPVVKPPPPDVDYLPAQVAKKSDTGATLTETQLAGATMAGAGSGSGGGGSGGGGGLCDMAGRVQAALRRDPMVRAAIAGSPGKATLVWNGDWVRDLGEDGKGLAIIREAIMWEVAFAPAACRAQPVRGMVVLSLNGAGGATRLALGGGSWRWSDLLTPHPGMGEASSEQ